MLCLNFWCPVSSAAVMQSSLIGAMMLPGLPLRTMASSKNGRADGKKVMECNGQEIEQRWCGERLICQTVKSHWDACIISCDSHTSQKKCFWFILLKHHCFWHPYAFAHGFNVFFRFLAELHLRTLLKVTSKPRFSKAKTCKFGTTCTLPSATVCFMIYLNNWCLINAFDE